MSHPPIKRHESLQPFSREHLLGLSLARDLRGAAIEDGDAVHTVLRRVVEAWEKELRGHFQDEERLLEPLIDDGQSVERLRSEHREIESMIHQASAAQEQGGYDPALAGSLGEALHDHIRWEERELFPSIESRMDEATAQALGVETAKFAEHRVSARTAMQQREMGRCSSPGADGER